MLHEHLGDYMEIAFQCFWSIGSVTLLNRVFEQIRMILIVGYKAPERTSPNQVHLIASGAKYLIYPGQHAADVEGESVPTIVYDPDRAALL